jgi:hypothetical protein
MIEILKDVPDGVVAVRASGTLTREEYDEVVVPLRDEARRAGRRLRCLCEVGADYRGLIARRSRRCCSNRHRLTSCPARGPRRAVRDPYPSQPATPPATGSSALPMSESWARGRRELRCRSGWTGPVPSPPLRSDGPMRYETPRSVPRPSSFPRCSSSVPSGLWCTSASAGPTSPGGSRSGHRSSRHGAGGHQAEQMQLRRPAPAVNPPRRAHVSVRCGGSARPGPTQVPPQWRSGPVPRPGRDRGRSPRAARSTMCP